MSRRKRSLLVPEARAALDQLRQTILVEKTSHGDAQRTDQGNDRIAALAQSMKIPYHAYNGNLKANEAGKLGGEIGGTMVRRLVAIAEQQLKVPMAAKDRLPRNQ